jgi:hypothetical protein
MTRSRRRSTTRRCARIEDTGSTIIANTPEQFAQQIKAEYETYKSVAESQKLKPE